MFQSAIVELPNAVIVQLRGEVDLATALTFRDALESAAKREKPILLDMTNIQYFDTSGARVIEPFHRYMQARAWQVAIISPPPTVRRGLQLMGVDQRIRMFESLDEALAALPAAPPGPSEEPGGPRTVL